MEIGPITGIRAFPVMKIPSGEPQLSAIFDIENSASAGDDSYSGGGKKSSGGQNDENEDLDEVSEGELGLRPVEYGAGTRVNYVA